MRWAGHVARMGDRKVVYGIVNLAEALWEPTCTIIVSKHLYKTTLIYTTRVLHLRRIFITQNLAIFELLVLKETFSDALFIRYSVITQFAKLTAGEQLCRRCDHRKL